MVTAAIKRSMPPCQSRLHAPLCPTRSRRVLLCGSDAFVNIELRRATLLLALPGTPYAAIRTIASGSRLLGVESNLLRLLRSAAASSTTASPLFRQDPHKGDPDTGTPSKASNNASNKDAASPSAEDLMRFRARAWKDLRNLLRLSHFYALSPAESELKTRTEIAAGDAPLLPEGVELAVTMMLTSRTLPEILAALGLPQLSPEASEASSAAEETPCYEPSSATEENGSLSPLNLLMLAEPLLPSPAICNSPPAVPLAQERSHDQQLERQALYQNSSSVPESQLQRSSSNGAGNARAATTSTASIRWCNVLLFPHQGRAKPSVKSTDWALERQSLLREAQLASAEIGRPIEEVILENEGSLLEGCSSNLLVYSAARGCVLTAPDSLCLPGSTRGLVIRALAAEGIDTVYETPKWERRETERWEAAWISSASRLLLPVRSMLRLRWQQQHGKQQQHEQQQQLEQQQQHEQQQKQHEQQPHRLQAAWTVQRFPSSVNARVFWLQMLNATPQDDPMGHKQKQQQLGQQQLEQQRLEQQPQHSLHGPCSEQPLGRQSAAEFEETLFDVGPQSLAARAAEWTKKQAEAEAEPVFL